jgi:putative transposase
MYKLNLQKIRWILRQLEKGELSPNQIAKQQNITLQWVYGVRKKYGGIPIRKIRLEKTGRKVQPITAQETHIAIRAKERYGLGAIGLEKILARKGIRMSHNRIHRVLLGQGLAKKEPKKSRQRKWVRWERMHSNSMWHTDYFETDNGRQAIVYEDDASRNVVGCGEFPRATTDNAIAVFDSAVAEWGIPRELLTDRGSQFCEDESNEYRFRKHVEAYGTKHILARVKHPQTNGKQERLGGTLKGIMRWRKCTLEEAVKFYNEVRPHMSLEKDDCIRTPLIAYYEKMQPKYRNGTAYAERLAYAKNAEAQAWLELGLNSKLVVE